jgi:hypothetical protein
MRSETVLIKYDNTVTLLHANIIVGKSTIVTPPAPSSLPPHSCVRHVGTDGKTPMPSVPRLKIVAEALSRCICRTLRPLALERERC